MIVVSVVDERAKGLALGAADYLVKPVQRDQLLRRARGRARVEVPEADPRSAGAEVRTVSRGRILVVEDNALNLKLVRDVLVHAGLRRGRGDVRRGRRAARRGRASRTSS